MPQVSGGPEGADATLTNQTGVISTSNPQVVLEDMQPEQEFQFNFAVTGKK